MSITTTSINIELNLESVVTIDYPFLQGNTDVDFEISLWKEVNGIPTQQDVETSADLKVYIIPTVSYQPSDDVYQVEPDYISVTDNIIYIKGNPLLTNFCSSNEIIVQLMGQSTYAGRYNVARNQVYNGEVLSPSFAAGKADIDLSNVSNDDFLAKAEEAGVGGSDVDLTPYRTAADQDVIDGSLDARITTLENGEGIDLSAYRTATEEDEINQQLFDIVPLMESGDLRVVTDFNDFSQWTKTVEYVTYTVDTNSKPAQDLGVVRVQKHIDYDDLDNEMVVLTLDARTTGNDVLFRRISENGTNLGAWRGVATSADLKEYTFDKEYIELNDRWNKDIADTFHKSEIGDVLWEWDMSAYSVGPVTEDMLPENEFNEGLDRTEIVNDGVENSLRVMYPQGVYNASASGCQIEYHFEGGEHYMCEYDLLFEDGFSFGGNAQGGKLPGLTNTERCQPEFYNNGTNGWSARPMWRADNIDSDTEFDWVPHGQTTIVGYLYQKREGSEYGTLYGDDIQPNRKTEASLLTPGTWYHITQEVKMNTTPNAYDGYVRYWLDGELLMSKYGISWSEDLTKNIDTFFFSTFHGGDSIDFAPLNDSYAQFKNIKVSTIKEQSVEPTVEEDPVFQSWLSTFDTTQFVNKEAQYVGDFNDLTLDSGYYYTDDLTTNDTPGGNVSNAQLIVTPTLRIWFAVDKWNNTYIRSYIVSTDSWNPWRKMSTSKDLEPIEASIDELTSVANSRRYYENINNTVHTITADTPVTLGTISGYDAGTYRIYFGCFTERTFTAQQTMTFNLYAGDTLIVTENLTTAQPKKTPINWVSPIRYALDGGDLRMEVVFDGSAGLTIKDVVWSIEGTATTITRR